MVFTTHADQEYIDLHYPISSEPDSTAPQLSDFRRDRLKSKLRNGIPIHTTDRPELYKKLILSDVPEENEPITPILQSLIDVDGDALERHLASCSVFDAELMRFPWLTPQGHIVRNLILQDIVSTVSTELNLKSNLINPIPNRVSNLILFEIDEKESATRPAPSDAVSAVTAARVHLAGLHRVRGPSLSTGRDVFTSRVSHRSLSYPGSSR